MKVYNKGVVYDFDEEKEYILDGVVYNGGFRGGNGLVFVLAEDEGYAAIQEVSSVPCGGELEGLEKLTVSTVAQLKNYSFEE